MCEEDIVKTPQEGPSEGERSGEMQGTEQTL